MGRFSEMVQKAVPPVVAETSRSAPSGYARSNQPYSQDRLGSAVQELLGHEQPEQWASEPKAFAKSLWMAYNGHLESHSKGLKFRRSPELKDTNGVRRRLLEFGETVEGIPTEDGWLKVGRYYLPMEVQGSPVLIRADPSEQDDGNQGIDPAAMWKDWKLPKPLYARPEDIGTGVEYEVVHDRIVGRPAPSLAAPKQSLRQRGDTVELFEFDETRKWRRGLDGVTFHMVWFLIDHPEIGPLLRPKGEPLSVKPLDPICVAAQEDLSQDLQRFIDEGSEVNLYDVSGRTPLMLAAAKGHMDCCVLLVEGGADPKQRSLMRGAPVGKTAVELAKSAQTKALLKAICGYKDFEFRQFDKALENLRPENAETVERLFDASMRAVDRGLFLVEGQEGREQEPPPFASDLSANMDYDSMRPSSPGMASSPSERRDAEGPPRARGKPYEVCYNAVWIRKEPDVNAGKISVKKDGDVVEVLGVDETGDWAHVQHEVYAGHYVPGWMMIRHDKLGELLKPAFLADAGPLASPSPASSLPRLE